MTSSRLSSNASTSNRAAIDAAKAQIQPLVLKQINVAAAAELPIMPGMRTPPGWLADSRDRHMLGWASPLAGLACSRSLSSATPVTGPAIPSRIGLAGHGRCLIAVLVKCPTELGEHDDNGVVPVVCEKCRLGQFLLQKS
jgi:hypothetical protein